MATGAMRQEYRAAQIPGEDNTADLMTKHLAIAIILRHMKKLNLIHIKGRSDAAATLHLVSELPVPIRTTSRSSQIIESAPRKSHSDYWAERDEHDPWRAPRGPGRKTRLGPTRRTMGVFDNGDEFGKNVEWQNEDDKRERLSWTGLSSLLTINIPKLSVQTREGKEHPHTTNLSRRYPIADLLNPMMMSSR